MSKVVAIMSMSLDGFVADRNDGVAEVFDWYMSSGDVEIDVGGSDPMSFHVPECRAPRRDQRGHRRGSSWLRSSTLRPPRRHTGRPWQSDGDPGRRRYTPALPGTQGVVGPHTLT
jgi:hypothetical protein